MIVYIGEMYFYFIDVIMYIRFNLRCIYSVNIYIPYSDLTVRTVVVFRVEVCLSHLWI